MRCQKILGYLAQFNGQVRPHGLSIYSQHGFILIMDALGTKRITDKMDPRDCYNR